MLTIPIEYIRYLIRILRKPGASTKMRTRGVIERKTNVRGWGGEVK